ncbi:apoptosis-antagonizing transcription factor [Zopfochytrium polystomum]|nr:apoptosis-antagonizing transcription factor [Zopfochytrium polystomum]
MFPEEEEEEEEGEEEEGSDAGSDGGYEDALASTGFLDGLEDGDGKDDDGEDDEDDDGDGGELDSENADDDDGDELEEDNENQGDDAGKDEDDKAQVEEELKRLAEEEKKMIKSFSQAASADVEKGTHVKAQMGLWDAFLDLRMDFQKPLIGSNLLPSTTLLQVFADASPEAHAALAAANKATCALVDDLLDLQQSLINNNPLVTSSIAEGAELAPKLASRKRKRQSGGESFDVTDVWEDVHSIAAALLPFREATIEKWNSKVLAASGATDGAQKKFKAIDQSVLSQIRTILRDKERLIKRTQLVRFADSDNVRRLGDVSFVEKAKNTSENSSTENGAVDDLENAERRQRRQLDLRLSLYDSEVFDDSDFYQQLLKELIDSRLADTDDPILLSMKHATLKKLQSKAKKKKIVDTKASKGRKLRYHVHEKLLNFMAPQPLRGGDSDTWHEGMVEELFANLFGLAKAKESEETADASRDFVVPEDGLRLFG